MACFKKFLSRFDVILRKFGAISYNKVIFHVTKMFLPKELFYLLKIYLGIALNPNVIYIMNHIYKKTSVE